MLTLRWNTYNTPKNKYTRTQKARQSKNLTRHLTKIHLRTIKSHTGTSTTTRTEHKKNTATYFYSTLLLQTTIPLSYTFHEFPPRKNSPCTQITFSNSRILVALTKAIFRRNALDPHNPHLTPKLITNLGETDSDNGKEYN